MAVLIASGLRKELTGDPLFDGVSFKVERRDRLALSGANGAGKTTLLRAIAGETELQGGELAFAKGTRVALHDQRPPLERDPDRPELTLRDYVLSGAADLIAVEQELRNLETRMASGDHGPATLRRYSDAQGRLEHAGGYAWRERIGSVVHGLGFAESDLDRPLATFSGGELTRASLARALGGDPDLLLLDEPTNHLDVESLEWLEEELGRLDAAVILVAHDRWFLEAVTNSTLELEGGRSTYFAGPWHAWRREKAAREALMVRTAEKQAEELARLERFVERFRYKASKAKQAQARVKKIEKLQAERVVVPRGGRRTLGFEFLKPARSGRTVAEARDLRVEVPGRVLVEDATFALERGEHAALVGPNGSGKSTLLQAIVEERGVRLGHDVKVGYFSQQEMELDTRGSVLEAAQGATGLRRPEAQALLGRFLFSGWGDHDKPVVALSGGERRRLALAIVVASGANFLVLDEPTNHLDLESREALEAALEAFPGTLLLVSHDRALLDAVAERTLVIEDGRLNAYPGGWAEYQRRRDPQPAEPKPEPKPAKPPRPKPAREPAPSQLQRVEAQVAAAEAKVAELETKLADDWGDVDLLSEHRRARDELRSLLERWEELFESQQA